MVTPLGMVMLPVNPLQFLNASPAIDVTPEGMSNCPVKPVQPSKACVPMDVTATR
jgi:hypothetical protein